MGTRQKAVCRHRRADSKETTHRKAYSTIPHHVVSLPRLLFLLNFWAQFYITAKYGFEAEYLAPAKDLFKEKEAELAVQHAQECYQAASHLKYLSEEKMAALLPLEDAG